jgi:DNA-binding CsgD family transcriptional regulator
MTTVTITVSEKQSKVLKLLEQGLSQKEISVSMKVEVSRIRTIIYGLQEQFDCKNSVQLVCYAIRNGII